MGCSRAGKLVRGCAVASAMAVSKPSSGLRSSSPTGARRAWSCPGGAHWLVGVLALLFILACAAMAAGSGPLPRVTRDTRQLPLTDSVEIVSDSTGTMTASDAIRAAAQGRVQRVSQPRTQLALSQGTFWLKMDLVSDAAVPADWLLEVGRARIERVRLF